MTNGKSEQFVIEAAGIKAVAQRKNVKYIRISVKPPDGLVTVSVPKRASIASVRAFMEQKRDWIAEKQQQCRQWSASLPDNADRAMLWGEQYPLRVITGSFPASACLEDGVIVLRIRQDTADLRSDALDGLYRSLLMARLPSIAEKWESRMGVHASEWRTRRMKTRWGSCNTTQHRIWLNVHLAALRPECLDYVAAHELCHLLEPSHNARFYSLMDGFCPEWKQIRQSMKSMSGVLY